MGLPLLGAGTSLLSGLFGLFSGKSQAEKQQEMADAINPEYKKYETSQYAKDSLGLAKSLYGGRMEGAVDAEQNIRNNTADAFANAGRVGTSGSQLLAATAGLGAQADDQAIKLAVQEAQDRMNRAGLVMNANNVLVGEDHFAHQDMWNKYMSDWDRKSALQGAAMSNEHNSNQGFANLGMYFGNALSGVKKGANGKLDWSTLFG